MGKSSGSSEINNSNQYYQQLAGDANQILGYFQQYDLPLLQHLAPILMKEVQGKPNALATAAQAPVLAETARNINALKTNPSGAVNPNALYSDMALSGNQQAGLAGDQMMTAALSGLQNLLNMGYGSQSSALSGLNSAAGGEGNLGLNLNQQGNEWWQQLLGAAGTAAGAFTGGRASAPSIMPSNTGPLNTGMGFDSPASIPYSSPALMPAFDPTVFGNVTAAGTTINPSSPISSNNSSYRPPPNQGY